MKNIGEGEMKVVGEGSVAYLVEEDETSSSTLSMFKIKSTEYQIYRLIREYLKRLFNKLKVQQK